LEADPSNVDLINNLAWVLCEARNAPAEASDLVSGVIESAQADPAFPNLLDTWGTIQMRLGHLDAAADAFRRCREDSRTDPTTRAAATVRLVRALAPSNASRGLRLLEELKTSGWELLSPNEQREAERLLSDLKGAS
jgi:Tfp pilus assembly protein PilF